MKRMLSIAVLGCMLGAAGFAQDQAAKQKAAEQVAQSWLTLVDHDDYGQSWEEAASYFQSQISKPDWESTMKQLRAQLGAAGKRSLTEAEYQTDIPNAPKGEYVVLQYKTGFSGKGTAIETVTPMLDKDGKWRVSGYFVRLAE